MPRIDYYTETEVFLGKHHVQTSILKLVEKGHMSIYDIELQHIYSTALHYIARARANDLPVILKMNQKKRLLIFNREL
jgi:hypothetical protein